MDKYFDWYNYEAVEKLQQERSRKYMDLVRKWVEAKESGKEEVMKKAFNALSKHKKENEVFKKKAEDAGQYWY